MLSWIIKVVLVKPMDFGPMTEIVGMVGSTSMIDGNTKMLTDSKVQRLSNNIECWWLLGGDRMCHNAIGHEPWCINFQVPPWFWLQPWFYTLHGWSLGYTWVGMAAKFQELSFGLLSDIIWINFQTIWWVFNRHEKQQRAEKIKWKPMITNSCCWIIWCITSIRWRVGDPRRRMDEIKFY